MQESYLAGMERAVRNVSLDSLARVLEALEVDQLRPSASEDWNLERAWRKQAAIRLLAAFLHERSQEEVELIRRIAKDVMTTIDSERIGRNENARFKRSRDVCFRMGNDDPDIH